MYRKINRRVISQSEAICGQFASKRGDALQHLTAMLGPVSLKISTNIP